MSEHIETKTVDVEVKNFIESDAGDGSKRQDQYLHGFQLAVCLFSLFLCLLLDGLDQTIVTSILSIVANRFNGFNKVGWLLSGYLFPAVVFATNWGQIGIIFGRKYTMLICILLFEAGSLMCALSQDMNTLIGGRVLTGVGAGGINTSVFVVISEVVDINYRPLTAGMFGGAMAISSVVGPLLGGAFTTNVSWRWCFYINLPIGGLAAVAFLFSFNPPRPKFSFKEQVGLIDYVGTVLFAAGVVIFLLGLTFTSTRQYEWNSATVIVCIILGPVILVIFGIWNSKYSKHQLMPVEVIRIPQIAAGGFTMFGMYGAYMPNLLYLSIYFQNIVGRDALHAGLSLIPIIIPMLSVSIVTGIAMRKVLHLKPFAVVGSALVVVGCALQSLLDVNISNSARIGLLIPNGFGNGLIIQSTLASCQLKAPKSNGGTIMTTAFLMGCRGLGGAFGSILGDLVYNSSLHSKLKSALASLPSSDPNLAHQLSGFSPDQLAFSTKILPTLSPKALHFIRSQLMWSIKNVFYTSAGFGAVCMIGAVFLSNQKLPKRSEVDDTDNKDSSQHIESRSTIERITDKNDKCNR